MKVLQIAAVLKEQKHAGRLLSVTRWQQRTIKVQHNVQKFDPIVNIVEAVNKKAMRSGELPSFNSASGPRLLLIPTVSACNNLQ